MKENKERMAILSSRGGTTAEHNIIDSLSGEIPVDIACVISSNPKAKVLERARRLIPSENIHVVDPNDFRGVDGKVNQKGFGMKLLELLEQHKVTMINQNGWLTYTPEIVVDEYEGKIFNQHPGPKKETRGLYELQPHAAMLYVAESTGRNMGTEVIVHRVSKEVDSGATVGVMRVPILDIKESPDTLRKRALEAEYRLQRHFLKEYLRGNLKEIKSAILYIKPGEERELALARERAIRIYPKG